jgi:hypothetical protein
MTRAFWESKSNSENSLSIVDKCCSSPPFRDAEVTYYSTMISVGPSDWHWCWFKPRADAMALIASLNHESRIGTEVKSRVFWRILALVVENGLFTVLEASSIQSIFL